MKAARSGIAMENLQEVLEAEATVNQALDGGQNQYFTPSWLVDQCFARLPNRCPDTILDPQAGEGALIDVGSWGTSRYGIDIDNRLEGTANAKLIIGNCVKVAEAMDDLYPDLHWDCVNANPPFGKAWKMPDESVMDSTEWTWNFCLKRGNYGFFISNGSAIEKLNLNKHDWVTHYEVHPGTALWKGVRESLRIGIVFWQRPVYKKLNTESELNNAWEKLQEVVEQEKIARPKFNIYLDHAGYLRTYLSVRSQVKLKLSKTEIQRLFQINNAHPYWLTTEKETRELMRSLISCGFYSIEPAAQQAIERALSEVHALACPLMPVTDFESVAYADEEEELTCIKSVHTDMHFTAGKRYPITTGTYKFVQEFTRKKVHCDEETGTTYTADHKCQLSGQDRYIALKDDLGYLKMFMDRPGKKGQEFEESRLWEFFAKPVVKTIAETGKEILEQNLAVLRSCEMMAGYKYFPGQSSYLARVASKPCGLVAGETGTGKTLMAISLLAMKGPDRALIIAPQGTMRSSDVGDEDDDEGEEYNASQWVQEINRFAPYIQIWELFSYEDYERICSLNGGKLPQGVFVSYYQAMFTNKAREIAPEDWNEEKFLAYTRGRLKMEEPPPAPKLPNGKDDAHHYCGGLGVEKSGIRCIASPCLATLIGDQFDMVILDEAHVGCNLGSMTTQMIIRLQPKFRYALTATPIPNIVSNLFSLMGWLAVPEWYKGGRRNAAWPYAREEIGKFNSTFLSTERDFTEEEERKRKDKKWRGTCVKDSPVISSPARLLKLLKPTMAFISKAECNPDYEPPKIIDVRVPMGKEQSALYAHYLHRGNIPAKNALVRARKQTAWLRAITADPAGFRHGDAKTPVVSSNMNPKVISILELTRDILAEGEQVIVINSRVGLTNTLQAKLFEGGVPMSRIDSTVPASNHAYQANLFKNKKTKVMLMGIKCAASYSFEKCKYAIIASLEYSPGPFVQAKGRIDRVVPLPERTIYCILHQNSIEETMFDTVATKDDAATICLKGQRVPRAFKPVDPSEILAEAIERFDTTATESENECESKWPKLRNAIRDVLASA